MARDGKERLWVAEAFRGQYTVFDSLGRFQKVEPSALRAVARFQHPLKSEGDGVFIDEGARSDAVLFLRVDTAGQVLDTLAQLSFPERSPALRGIILGPTRQTFRTVSRHYLPRLRWALGADGTVWSAETG
jgi:hypothetical protein